MTVRWFSVVLLASVVGCQTVPVDEVLPRISGPVSKVPVDVTTQAEISELGPQEKPVLGIIAQILLMNPNSQVVEGDGAVSFFAYRDQEGSAQTLRADESWSFSPADLAKAKVPHPLGQAYRFWLPLKKEIEPGTALDLVTTYIGRDGSKLVSQQQLKDNAQRIELKEEKISAVVPIAPPKAVANEEKFQRIMKQAAEDVQSKKDLFPSPNLSKTSRATTPRQPRSEAEPTPAQSNNDNKSSPTLRPPAVDKSVESLADEILREASKPSRPAN